MAKYIKASIVDAVKKERDGEAGYEVTDKKTGTVRWMDEDSFDDAYSLLAVPKPKVAPKPPVKPAEKPKPEAKKTAPKKK